MTVCTTCGEYIEPGGGYALDDKGLVHHRLCLERPDLMKPLQAFSKARPETRCTCPGLPCPKHGLSYQ